MASLTKSQERLEATRRVYWVGQRVASVLGKQCVRQQLLAIVLVACGGSTGSPPRAASATSTPSTEPQSSEPVPPPRFTWPLSHEVPVVEHVLRDGHRAETAYVVRTCPAKNGGLRVEHADFRIVSFDGVPASDPRLAPTIEQLTPLFAAIPVFVVDASGSVVDLEGVDAMLATLAKTFPAQKMAALTKALASEQARALFKEAVYSRWRAWVETWLAYDPKLGPVVEITSEESQKHELAFDGYVGGRARLSVRSQYTSEYMRSMLGSLFATLGVNDLDSKKLEHVQAEHSARVETDWPEIRPHRVISEKRISIAIEGKTAERLETHEYRFDWPAAKRVICRVPAESTGER